MARVSTWLRCRLIANQVLQTTGTLDVLFSSYYQKQKRTRNGVEVLAQRRTPSRIATSLDVPNRFLLRPDSHRDYLCTAITSLNLNIEPEYLDAVAHYVASLALALTFCPRFRNGYYIVVEMEYWHLEQVDERRDVLETPVANLDSVLVLDAMDSAPTVNFLESRFGNLDSVLVRDAMDLVPTGGGTGATRRTIEKLIKNGGFVAGESDQKLGTCSICLEELSSSAGTELLRTDCSHVYHRSCLLPWLKKQTTCPICRQQVAQR